MERALTLAARSCGHTRPNPPVGAVVVKGGRIIGEGRHVRCGCDHAEVAALKSAARRGGKVRGATVYVTLEPCSRPGRVGACCDALIAAGVAKVVWAVPDPNPKNAGRAARALARAGIATECWSRARQGTERRRCAEDARTLIAPFAKHVSTGMPFVTVKIAMSLDGRICDDWGEARWVSSERARSFTGRLREKVDVVMVGAETVRRDDPSLLSHGRRNDDLFRAVVTHSGKLPPGSQIFTDGARERTLVFRVGRRQGAPSQGRDIPVPDLRAALRRLGEMGFMHVLCEGGLELARSLAAEGLVDEWLGVIAPKVIGHGRIASAVRIDDVRLIVDG
jgi:diaminohydroxyphosphoribosylaminopyrimidine deaminase/5-amino-6-(5-phosphoribosylamino)uracil reductase